MPFSVPRPVCRPPGCASRPSSAGKRANACCRSFTAITAWSKRVIIAHSGSAIEWTPPAASGEGGQDLFGHALKLPLLVVARRPQGDGRRAGVDKGADLLDAALRRAGGDPAFHKRRVIIDAVV